MRVIAVLHVPPGLWIVVGAALALVMGSVAAGLRSAVPDRTRNKLLIALTVWLAIDAALGAIGVFAADVNRPVPGIAPGIALPILGSVWLLGRSEGIRRLLAAVPLRRLIGVQVYRVAGGVFIFAWASGRMPAAFALPAGLGDIAVGVTAPIVAVRLDEHSTRSVARAVLWNILGIADLVRGAVTLRRAHIPDSLRADRRRTPQHADQPTPVRADPRVRGARVRAAAYRHTAPPARAQSRSGAFITGAVEDRRVLPHVAFSYLQAMSREDGEDRQTSNAHSVMGLPPGCD